MPTEALVKLVASGNARTVEEEWMKLVESTDVSPAALTSYDRVLGELARQNRGDQAEALAWAALESLSTRFTPCELVSVASPFLLAVGDREELRQQVTELYRKAYAEREALEELIAEARLPQGRPVRRALRTLDVCLSLSEGDYLRARDDESSARVDTIDLPSWEFHITSTQGAETVGAVHLADRYMRTDADDYCVLRQFAPETLQKRLADDPTEVITQVCKQCGGSMPRDTLESYLVPSLLSQANWKKWWTRARAALKKNPNLEIERRAPYTITHHETALEAEDLHLTGFDKLHDPVQQLDAVEQYYAACKARGTDTSKETMDRCFVLLRDKAKRFLASKNALAGMVAMVARRVGELAGRDDAGELARETIKTSRDLRALFGPIRTDAIHQTACATLVEVRPESWPADVLAIFSNFPMGACDREAARLLDAGKTAADFEPVVDDAFASPVDSFEVLAWLWNGPQRADELPQRAPINILSRLFRGVDECRRDDAMAPERRKKVLARARSVLSARKLERFDACIANIEPAMAAALRTQIGRLDNLGRAVSEDMQRRLHHRFPSLSAKPEIAPWAMEDVLFVTKSGLLRKHKELDHHVNVTMKENARAIGAAAEHGDLSENSEYKFALEERDLLRARLAQMNDELSQAKVIDPNRVPTDHIGIGTLAVFSHAENGTRYTMAIAGPWEADPDKGWINYKAPLAQRVLGSRIGDTIEFDHSGASGTYEVVELRNAFTEDEE